MDPFGSFTSFGGQTVGSSALVIKYTKSGDANLDGKVDLTDYFIVTGNWMSTSGLYAYGDMDYDRTVDLDDYFAVTGNWGPNDPPLGANRMSQGESEGGDGTLPQGKTIDDVRADIAAACGQAAADNFYATYMAWMGSL